MADVMVPQARHRFDMDSWTCWDNVLCQLSGLHESSRAGSAARSSCQAGVIRVGSLSRCHSSDAEDALCNGHGQAQQKLQQPAQDAQLRSHSGHKPACEVLQSLDDYLASTTTSEYLQEPLFYDRCDELAMDGSCASSQSGDSFLALMLGAEGSPAQQPAHSSPAAAAALPNGPTCYLLAGAGKAAHAEQPPRCNKNSCFEASPALPDRQLDEMFLQADSSDGSAEWSPSAQAQPYGVDPSNLQQAAQLMPMPSKKRGRPRRYDTILPLGTMDAHMAATVATVNGMQPGVRKRGAKPKYKFITAEEAVAHRRERNRSTAIATHEKKKAREAALKAELSMRQGEHDALQRLLDYVQQPKADKEMVRKLLLGEEGAEGSICDAMEFLLTAED